jgi:hypothetical protein
MRAGAPLLLVLLALTPATVLAQGDASDAAIDQRIRASAEAAESLQGPLDGAWTLVGADGAAIYAFQFVDKPTGEQPEGVWRDLRRPRVPGDIGLVDMMVRNGGALNLSFIAADGAPPVMIVLRTGADGVWSGQLTEAGKTTTVTLRRG